MHWSIAITQLWNTCACPIQFFHYRSCSPVLICNKASHTNPQTKEAEVLGCSTNGPEMRRRHLPSCIQYSLLINTKVVFFLTNTVHFVFLCLHLSEFQQLNLDQTNNNTSVKKRAEKGWLKEDSSKVLLSSTWEAVWADGGGSEQVAVRRRLSARTHTAGPACSALCCIHSQSFHPIVPGAGHPILLL